MTRRRPSDKRALVIIPQRGGKRATFLKRGLQKAFRFTRFHASSRTRLPNIRSKMSSIEDNLLDNGRERGSLESKLIKGACRRRRGLSSERRRGKKAGEGREGSKRIAARWNSNNDLRRDDVSREGSKIAGISWRIGRGGRGEGEVWAGRINHTWLRELRMARLILSEFTVAPSFPALCHFPCN